MWFTLIAQGGQQQASHRNWESVYNIADSLASPKFPKVEDILAIAWIESTFNPKAKNSISNGIMQVNNGSFDMRKNMEQGVKLLIEYYNALGSEKAAVIAYNVGIGNYRKGNFGLKYWNKFQKAKKEIESETRGPSGSSGFLRGELQSDVPADSRVNHYGGHILGVGQVERDERTPNAGTYTPSDPDEPSCALNEPRREYNTCDQGYSSSKEVSGSDFGRR